MIWDYNGWMQRIRGGKKQGGLERNPYPYTSNRILAGAIYKGFVANIEGYGTSIERIRYTLGERGGYILEREEKKGSPTSSTQRFFR